MSNRTIPISSITPRSPNFLTVFNHNNFPEIADRLCYHLSLADVLSLSRTCSALHQISRSQWNIDRQLTRVFLHPRSLRAQLGRSRAILSGEIAFDFFHRQSEGTAPDVQIWVENGASAEALHKFLVKEEGCEVDLDVGKIEARNVNLVSSNVFIVIPVVHKIRKSLRIAITKSVGSKYFQHKATQPRQCSPRVRLLYI